jgi:capsular polysaccharide transport system permease protein
VSAWFSRNLLFLLLVAAPTGGAIVYYGFIASDIYISEAHFVVRNMQHQTAQSGLASLLGGASLGSGDTYLVRDYILSRDALKELDQKLSIRSAFSSKHADIINRFPGLSWDESFEEFFRYYGKHVGVEYDSVSSISILTVRAFTAEDAYKINGMLMEMSERLVNTLNDRSAQDLIHFSDNEVKIASDKAKDASLALLSYRSAQSVFEPSQQAALQLAGVAKIHEELISTEAELAQLQKLSPDNPQIPALTNRAETLRGAIASESSKVTNAHGSFSAHAANFERLTLDSGFADRQLGVALAGLETARSEARQKHLYLELLVQPSLPDKAMEPRRIRSMFTVFIVGLIGWGVVSLLIASVREHAD